MVQILPAPQTFGSELGKGLGSGLSATLADRLNAFHEEKKQAREQNRIRRLFDELGEDATIQDKMSAVLGGNLSPQAQKQAFEFLRQQGAQDFANKLREGAEPTIADIIEGTALGYIPPGIGQELVRPFTKDPLQARFLEQFLQDSPREGIEQTISETVTPQGEQVRQVDTIDMPIPTTPPRVTRSGSGWNRYSDDDLTQIMVLGGDVGKSARAELSRRQKEEERAFKAQESNEKRRQFGHQQTADYAKNLRESADNAREVIDAVNEIRRISEEGITGVNARNLLTSYLSSQNSFLAPALIDKDRQSLISATKTLAGGFRQLFGARPTQREFFWYENILPNLLKNADSNIAAAEYFGKVANYNLRAQQIADDIVLKNNGYRPLDIDARVRKELKKERDALVAEGEKLNKQIEKESPPDQFKAAGSKMEKMPSAKDNAGRIIFDEKGNRYRSNGKTWRRI